MSIEIFPLGAGKEVGRSCIIVNILDKTIMFDCGLHMTHCDNRRFPDFDKIPPNARRKNVDLCLITHFHLDHCGALPYFTELHGYDGPVVMSLPTKALLPHMLEDYRRVYIQNKKIWTNPNIQKEKQQEKIDRLEEENDNSDKEGEKKYQNDFQDKKQKNDKRQKTPQKKFQADDEYHQDVSDNKDLKDPLLIYSSDQIKSCVERVTVIGLNETQVHNDIEVTAYYAGHLLGACMFHIRYKEFSVVYTGDYNSLSDRHLGAAFIDKLKPDVLISESTYATIVRDSKRTRERKFLVKIQDVLDKGGKVLIPVFALGRAQELSVLLESYWSRTRSQHQLYFAAGMIEKANQYYRLFQSWESEKIQDSFLDKNLFNFQFIKPFDRNLIKSASPMVLLATPGMLHGGLSMQVFKEWCTNEKNCLVIPGYCVPGTLGNKLLSGAKQVKIDNKDYEVKIQIENIPFSAHADTRGILQMIKHVEPTEVTFVHGDEKRMKTLGNEIIENMKIMVHCPGNFESLKINKVMKLQQQIKFVGDFKLVNSQLSGYLLEYEGHKVLIKDEKNIMNEVRELIKLMKGEDLQIKQYKIETFLLHDNLPIEYNI